MKRLPKIAPLGLILLLGILAMFCWLCIRAPARVPPPRLTFVSFTNGINGERLALFSLSNSARTTVLFASAVLVQARTGGMPAHVASDGRSYELWVGNPPERPASPLLPAAATIFAIPVPELGSNWVERVIWQPQPTKAQHAYALAVDAILRSLHRPDYPSGLRPSARTWGELMITSDIEGNQGAEPGAPPNGGPGVAIPSSGVGERHHP